jgi:AAA15 family ATPase/GTPase
MKLIKALTTMFRSVEDSNIYEIGDLTCLVGKNEAGKTAILQSLYGLKPFKSFEFDKTRDYPRRYLSKYDYANESGESKVIQTWWELEQSDIDALNEKFADGVLKESVISIYSGIGFECVKWIISVNENDYIEHLLTKHSLNAVERSQLKGAESTEELAAKIASLDQKTEKQISLKKEIDTYKDNSLTSSVADFLYDRLPSMFYTSHYDRMAGEISLNKLARDKATGNLVPEDEIFLDFLEYAGTTIDELRESSKYEDLKAQCEGASNDITDEIFEFWSQNEALSVQIDLGEGREEDPEPFNSGTIAKIRIYNQNHRASVPLSERSAGFVWFFSFLSQFKQLQNTTGNAIILLDEPGLTLHGKAQADLLRYIQERLLPDHQVIYTTHSPFMVPADKLENVRVVEDVVEYDERGRATVHGTKVSSEVLSVDQDTIFPLQGHLGYELTQSLFIGKNTLLVEGPSDILYLQALSQELKNRGREGLSPKWVICPTGGIDKVQSFASLFGGNNINVAVLCDYASGDKKKVERLKESQILKSSQVFILVDFTDKTESDIEDIFSPDTFSLLLNSCYSLSGDDLITASKLNESTPKTVRLVKQAENVFKLLSKDFPEFDHFTPSSWLIRNPSFLEAENAGISKSLDVAERIFIKLNELLK